MYYVTLPDVNPDSTEVGEYGRRLVFYLAMEEYVSRHLDEILMDRPTQNGSKEAFFIWQVSPTVIFGRNQVMEAEVNLPYCRENGINLFRRKSGGGCVYSDLGNIMLSCVSDSTDVAFTFDRFLRRLALCLRRLGLNAEPSGRNDVLVDGKKVSGNAFYLMQESSVVHGTLLFDSDFNALSKAITPSKAKITSKGVASVRQHVANVRDFLVGSDDVNVRKYADIREFKSFLVDFFCEQEKIVLTPEQVGEIEEIEKGYLDPAFLEGRRKDYGLEFRGKPENVGEVAVMIDMKGDKIDAVHLDGDYFLVSELGECAPSELDSMLSSRLRGCPLSRVEVEKALEGLQLSKIVRNLDEKKLSDLIFNTDNN
ncbi:MAG: lipoate protein ligase C-terminal domain-containing protein [Bacteroidales bacterium]